MELKYKTSDVQKMIDVFAEIQYKKEAKYYIIENYYNIKFKIKSKIHGW